MARSKPMPKRRWVDFRFRIGVKNSNAFAASMTTLHSANIRATFLEDTLGAPEAFKKDAQFVGRRYEHHPRAKPPKCQPASVAPVCVRSLRQPRNNWPCLQNAQQPDHRDPSEGSSEQHHDLCDRCVRQLAEAGR
ncbi:MAG: hypothetical protein JWP47_886 [Polaromonas sp.]|nr:hypothetical protein [Polaromonas sp.]